MLHIPKKALLLAGKRIKPQDVWATGLASGNVFVNFPIAPHFAWMKGRDAAGNHFVFDSARPLQYLQTNTASAEQGGAGWEDYSPDGVKTSIRSPYSGTGVIWAARQARGFLSIVTYTGNGVAGRQIPHDLGVVPGMIVVKDRAAATNWAVYHRSLGATKNLKLNLTNAETVDSFHWNDTAPTASVFTVGASSNVNTLGETYVAYVFAHNPDLIDCGSFTTDASGNATVTTGRRPQFVMLKAASTTGQWWMLDAARGMGPGSTSKHLIANLSNPEADSASTTGFARTSTGFTTAGQIYAPASAQCIYLSIPEPY